MNAALVTGASRGLGAAMAGIEIGELDQNGHGGRLAGRGW